MLLLQDLLLGHELAYDVIDVRTAGWATVRRSAGPVPCGCKGVLGVLGVLRVLTELVQVGLHASDEHEH